MGTETIVEDDRWNEVGLGVLTDQAVIATLAHLRLGTDFQVSVLGCDDTRIAELNRQFRDKATPTNVLSWPEVDLASDNSGEMPLVPEPGSLGDIAIAFDTCEHEAAEQGKKMPHHVTHLIVHATLHLLGYDHEDDGDAALMEGLEVEILGNLGISNPYM